MNLYTGKETKVESNNPSVNNNIGNVVCSPSQRNGYKLFYLLWLTIIGGIVFLVFSIQKKNQFLKLQLEINGIASNIDVMLEKRSATLVKLLDATKGHMKYEKDTLTKIAALRSGLPADMSTVEKSNLVNDAARSMRFTFENYPNLKAGDSIQQLMNESAYIEKELAANRRLYNQYATQFNVEIFLFPWCVLAERMKLATINLFVATEEARKDVKLDL